MSKKNLIKLIKILFVFATGVVILFLVFRQSSNLNNHKKGRAVFYHYDFEAVNSIIKTASAEQLLPKLFIQSDPQNESVKAGIIEPQSRYAAGYLAEKDCQVFPAQVKNDQRADSTTFLFKGVTQKGSSAFAGDSVFIPTPQQLNSIVCDSLYSKYNDYHNSFISTLGFNSKIINFYLPAQTEKKPFERVLGRLTTEIENLHENRILSILDLRSKSLGNDSVVAQNQIGLFSNLISTGLCGVILHNLDNLELLDSLGFDGLFIFEVSCHENLSKEIIALADAFLLPNDIQNQQIATKIGKQLKMNSLRKKAFKVLRAALWTNRHKQPTFVADYKTEDWLRSNITKSSLILLKNADSLIPFSNVNHNFLVINTTGENIFHFKLGLANYTRNVTYLEHRPGSAKPLLIPKGIDKVIVLSNSLIKGLNESETATLGRHKSIIFVHSGNELSIPLKTASTVVQIHSITDQSLSYSAQLLFGGIASTGILSQNHNDTLIFGYGLNTKKTRLEFTLPENAGLCSQRLQQIDSIITHAVISRAFPGAQVLVAKSGKVVYNKTFGHHDYTRARQVRKNDLYDVASLTKIAATTLAAMKLHEQNKLVLNHETGRYFKDTSIDYGSIRADTIVFIDTLNLARISKNELAKLIGQKDTLHLNDSIIALKETVISRVTPSLNIFKIPIRQLLVHQSGMSPSLPILPYIMYRQTYSRYQAIQKKNDDAKEIDAKNHANENQKAEPAKEIKVKPNTTPFNFFFSRRKIDGIADVWVAENIYLRNQFRDSIYQNVKKLRVHQNPRFQYSCMNMILVQMVIDSINKSNLDVYLKINFYHPLGMHHTTFNPLRLFGRTQITPTENDTSWRDALVHGTVHDPSAALLGGIAGNAGLFSTATDLAILGQMWLNGGSYGGRKYLHGSTIKVFTGKQAENHRGLGFDKPSDKGIHAESISKSAFGHLGFTGCAMWIDPANDIVFIFLSNRIHPSVSNQRINTLKVRQMVHQVVYDAIITQPKNQSVIAKK